MKKNIENKFGVLAVLLLSLSSSGCAAPFERFMQEGHEFRNKNKLDKARQSFHSAVMNARQQKRTEQLVKALEAEIETASMQNDDEGALTLRSEEFELLSKKKEDPQKLAGLEKEMAINNRTLGNDEEARKLLGEAFSRLKRAEQTRTELACEIQAAIGQMALDKKDYKTALKLFESTNKTLDTAVNRDLHFQADVLHKLAFIYEQLNRENDAIECEERAKNLELGSIKNKINLMPQ